MYNLITILMLSGLGIASIVPMQAGNNGTDITGVDPFCPSPFVQYSNSTLCFYASGEQDPLVNRLEADAECRALEPSAILARPRFSSIDTFIRHLVRASGFTRSWMDLNDFLTEGNYTFSDGFRPTYTSWNGNEPNLSGSYHCVFYRGDNQLWNSEHCSARYRYVCQVDMYRSRDE